VANNVLNRVMEMQQQGYPDDQISTILSEEGISPKEIADALNKSQIKAAVYQPEYPAEYPEAQFAQQAAPGGGEAAGGMPSGPSQSKYPEYVQGMSSETVSEITEQIVTEKLNNVLKPIADISAFKESSLKKVSMIDDRLKKVESLIEELRSAITRRIGDFGQNVEEIKNEMSMMQDTFSKALKPIIERKRETSSETKSESDEAEGKEVKIGQEKEAKRAKKENKEEDFLGRLNP